MKPGAVDFRSVSFTHDGASDPLLKDLTCSFPAGWTGIVGANGAGKTTLLKIATGMLKPVSGSVHIPGTAAYCEQRTDDIPPSLANLLDSTDREACRIKGSLDIAASWLGRWDRLSHGERKRAQIGVILWNQPEVLAIDEPTNHLDVEARELLVEAMKTFRGIGLLVSHDRELLDDLCLQCLFMDPPESRMRPGGYTRGSREAAREEEHLRKRSAAARTALKKLRRETAKRKQAAAQADRRRSKRGLARGDHDAREKIDRVRASGKDGAAGRLFSQLDGRLQQARAKKQSIKTRKVHSLGIWMPGSRSRRDLLFEVEARSFALGSNRRMMIPDLSMRPDDRIALTGPNGAGKSTLVRHVVQSSSLPQERVTYVPQEIDRHSGKDILDRARGLPPDKLGVMMTAVSRLGSRPQRLLDSDEPSPGERR